MSRVLVLHLQLSVPLFSQRSRKTKAISPASTMAQTSTIVHSISSSKSAAAAPPKTSKNLAVPLAVLLSLAVIGAPSSRSCLAPTAAPTVAPTISGLYKPTAAPTSDRAPTAVPTTTAVPTIEAKKPTAAPTTQEL